MGEQCIKGKWKVKAPKKIPKSSTPMIGIVYSALFKGKEVFGVLERVGGIEAYIRTIENKLISVDKRSLKVITA
jgi:hypothetical protein